MFPPKFMPFRFAHGLAPGCCYLFRRVSVEMRCTLMMQQVPFMQESLARALSKASSDVPKRYLNMNLVQYCEEYGEDYDEILLAARTPKEREGFLAQFADEDDGEEEKQDENDPGYVVRLHFPLIL